MTPSCFRVDSPTHSFLQLTFATYEDAAVAEFKKGGIQGKATTKGLVKALALDSPQVVSELLKVASGELVKHLSERGWRPGQPVATYWAAFAAFVPAIAWIMVQTYGHGRRTTTKGGCFFSVCNNVIEVNAALSTNSMRMLHHTNVRHSAIVDYQKAMKEANSKASELPKRLLRNESSRQFYAKNLHFQAAQVSVDIYSTHIEDSRGEDGKKRKPMAVQHDVSIAEQTKSQKTGRGVVGLSKVAAGAKQLDDAYSMSCRTPCPRSASV